MSDGNAGPGPEWVKSSLSYANGNCLEARTLPGGDVEVRNSRDREGPVLRFTADEWKAFIAGARNGEFDDFGGAVTAVPEPGGTPGQAAEPLTLRGQVAKVAVGLKREADLIEADPHLNPLIRPAIAEAYRTAAGRIDLALSDDSRRPARTVRDGISAALANLRRMGDACAPSRAAKVRAALAECERAVREAYEEDR